MVSVKKVLNKIIDLHSLPADPMMFYPEVTIVQNTLQAQDLP